ncbi:MAG: hypothetical protein U9O65_01785 [Thermotogota bacterium]|nr:hypothetical protein [Thermotogota bacterium]
MRKKLLNLYFKLTIPAFLIIAILFGIDKIVASIRLFNCSRIFSFILMFVALLFAFVIPFWYRLTFINKWKKLVEDKKYEEKAFLFEKNFLIMPLLTPYIMILSFIVGVDRIPMIIIILLSLYSVYYYYPSVRRINLEKRIFKVE